MPEKTQEQQQLGSSIEQNGAPAEPPRRQFITADAMTTMQEEQEKELKAMTSDIPVREQRFEWLAFWVAAAVAFGAGVWWVVLEPSACSRYSSRDTCSSLSHRIMHVDMCSKQLQEALC